ncbi:MAG: DMT family transporter [Desulfobacterales bacterium]|nr:DMT family transporter [Desulfobacterales bacterium]
MIWFFLSLAAALSIAARDVSIKSYKDLQPREIAALELFWALPALIIGCVFVETPPLDQTFWWTFILSIPINIMAYVLYLNAIKISPISLSVPFLAFTPIFMILTGFWVLGETINLWGGFGTGLIVIGSYILHFKKNQLNFSAPFSAFIHEKGSWYMLIVAVLFAFAAVIGKKAILHSSPLFFSYSFFLVFNVLILMGLFVKGKNNWQKIIRNSPKGLWLGSLLMIHISFHGLAISISTAVYMVAVKRSSILFSVLLSWLILKERDIHYRGLGTLIMFVGMIFITLLG